MKTAKVEINFTASVKQALLETEGILYSVKFHVCKLDI